MNDQQFAEGEGVIRHYEYVDDDLLVADFGAESVGTVDIVDGTAIVVVGDAQYEIDLPEGAGRAAMKNGVVTIEVDR